jgi:hypothetical protein
MNALKKQLEAIFKNAQHQEEALIEIYKLFIPDWDRVVRVHQWPSCGLEMWQFICRQFQEFDRQHHPEVIPGGAWLNSGFSHGEKLKDWEVDLTTCKTIREKIDPS